MSHVWPYMRLGLHAKRRHYWQIKIKFRFSGQIFEKKNSVIEFNENLVEPSCSIRTDGRTYWKTDRHDAFRNLAQDLYKSFLRFRLNLLFRNWLLCQRRNTRHCATGYRALSFRRVPKFANSDTWLHHISVFVRPCAWNNSVSTSRIFMKFDIRGFFWSSVEKIYS